MLQANSISINGVGTGTKRVARIITRPTAKIILLAGAGDAPSPARAGSLAGFRKLSPGNRDDLDFWETAIMNPSETFHKCYADSIRRPFGGLGMLFPLAKHLQPAYPTL
ncbi:MAG: hypothetical protein MUO33_03465 [Sedimentisphaerales bacterium]|nr:hypothetical protein [Sedimentisphaerales bacterium]